MHSRNAFVGAERTSHILQFKLKDDVANATGFTATDVSFTDAIFTPGQTSPEGLNFISADDSPTGGALLLVGNEASGTLTSYAIPEPSTYALLGVSLAGLIFTLRKRRMASK